VNDEQIRLELEGAHALDIHRLQSALEAEGLSVEVEERGEELRSVGHELGTAVFHIAEGAIGGALSLGVRNAGGDIKDKVRSGVAKFRERDSQAVLHGPDDVIPRR
jgi:hypothetical protein